MKRNLRLIIRENISKIFENYYDQDDYISSFDYEDISDMSQGGRAYKAFLRDLKDDNSSGEFKNPSDEELSDLINGLKQANLDLPSDVELTKQAENRLKRQLNTPDKSRTIKAKNTMNNIMGTGSYN